MAARSAGLASGLALLGLVACRGAGPPPDAVAGEPPASARPHWPSFRGEFASGVADGQGLPEEWDVESGTHLRFRVPIPGLAHSSPIVWGDRLYLTSAISSRPDATFRPGLYGDGDADDDRSVQRWVVYALDKRTGEILWERTAREGVPRDKRHVKATYANATPATDGRHVVALFGSEGLYAYDVDGRLLWTKDLGRLNVGAYDLPSYEWGSASSPILYDGMVVVQCDTQQDSFVLAADADTGETLWRTERDELPSWGTPTVYPGPGRAELITNGSNFIRGYDPHTGAELWRLGGSSKITAPTPILAPDRIVVASGRAPERPIFAVRPGATGDITLAAGRDSNEFVAWSRTQRGPYMPTPLAYRGRLYVLANNGLFDAYDLRTGAEIYRQRIPHAGLGFSASPVASDGRLYLPGEDGTVFVVRAGDEFELVATSSLGEPLMASPAISDGTLYLRAEKHLYAIGGDRAPAGRP